MNQTKKKYRLAFILGFVTAVALVGALLVSIQVRSASLPSDRIPFDAKVDFALMAQAWNAIQAHYVDRASIKPIPLTYGAISGMVAALGDTGHSVFLSPEMIKGEDEFTAGKYQGIGAEVRMKEGHVVIVTPLDGSPAQNAGLQPGQIILAVDGQDITGLNLFQVVKRISGSAGTRVALRIFDPKTGSTREVSLVRAAITMSNVTWRRLPAKRIAHLRIAAFSEGVTGKLRKALGAIMTQNLEGLILDLRNNPGGLLDEAISTASQFLSGGNVLLEKDADGRISSVAVVKGGLDPSIPMVVLLNGGTASAAEIVAGALQDHGRASLVGTTTFGTGTVLQQFPLSDGSALLLAVQEWLTPDGNQIWHKGITPKLVVSLPEGVAPLFPEQEQGMTPQQLKESRDTQLLKALKLITENRQHSSLGRPKRKEVNQ
ncbi:MAG: S41 family peptidase [Desulfobacterales bacterium]